MLLRMLSACYPGIVSHDQSDSPMRIWGQDQDPSNETIVDIFGHEQSQDFSQCLSSDVLPNSSFQANIMVPKVILYSCSFLIVLLRAAIVLVDTSRVTVFLWAQARVGPFSLELGQSVVKLVPSLCRKMPNSFGVAWFFCFRRARTLEGVFEPLSAETACNCKFMASRVQIFWIRCDSCLFDCRRTNRSHSRVQTKDERKYIWKIGPVLRWHGQFPMSHYVQGVRQRGILTGTILINN